MDQPTLAKIYWNPQTIRYELRILNVLKAYSTGKTQEIHEEGKALLCKLANENGYTVINDV
jgi:hypothetical protein